MTIESDIVAGDALLRLLRIDREWSPFVLLSRKERQTILYMFKK